MIHDYIIIYACNLIRYRGYFYDTETGFYYLNSRYYDPQIGRFITADNPDILTATPEEPLYDINLFAYCDNNPVMRADNGGDFWHIIVGAVVGAVVNGVAKVVTNLYEGKNITDGLGLALASGAASGALSSTGVGMFGQIAWNAAISMGENALYQVFVERTDNFDAEEMLTSGVVGGISGAIGGKGKGTKHLMNLGKQTVRRTVQTTQYKGVRAGMRAAEQAISYYLKSTHGYYKGVFYGLKKDLLVSGTGSLITADHKYAWRPGRFVW